MVGNHGCQPTYVYESTFLVYIILDNSCIPAISQISPAGIGMGIIWVVVPNFVTAMSKTEHIERNLTYHMFIYNFNGLLG